MTPVEAANAAVRFVLELCTLGAYSYIAAAINLAVMLVLGQRCSSGI